MATYGALKVYVALPQGRGEWSWALVHGWARVWPQAASNPGSVFSSSLAGRRLNVHAACRSHLPCNNHLQ